MDFETALSIVDDNLPDGAYVAMLSELTGLHPSAVCDALVERAERMRAKEPRKAKKPKRKR